jgi:hypothetical protein
VSIKVGKSKFVAGCPYLKRLTWRTSTWRWWTGKQLDWLGSRWCAATATKASANTSGRRCWNTAHRAQWDVAAVRKTPAVSSWLTSLPTIGWLSAQPKCPVRREGHCILVVFRNPSLVVSPFTPKFKSSCQKIRSLKMPKAMILGLVLHSVCCQSHFMAEGCAIS